VAGGIRATVANGIQADISGGIQPTVSGGITSNVASGILVTATGGLQATVTQAVISAHSDGITTGTANGITSAATGGISTVVSGGIASLVANGITTAVAGGIQSTTAGGFQLAGGASDWPTFSATRTRTVQYPCGGAPPPANWSSFGYGVGSTSTGVIIYIPFMPHNGATITSMQLYVNVGNPHAGGVPGTFPSFELMRQALTGTTVPISLNSGGATSFTAASGTAWYNSNNAQASPTYSANQNNVIDTTQFCYYLKITEESGANAFAGNTYPAFRVGFTAIADMRFA
jgi:hypothetical protein